MAQRIEPADSPDDFPTPPWATRALAERVLGGRRALLRKTCLEPACGTGYMVRPLSEYFQKVGQSDAHDYGQELVRDFLTHPFEVQSWDWVITNPPFRLAEEFVIRALQVARDGVAILARTVFIESVGRYHNLFERTPPTTLAQFTERVPMVKGRVDRAATTATSYAWLIWEKKINTTAGTRLVWVPPCRRELERDADYPDPLARIKSST
jgi:hypothetical protein